MVDGSSPPATTAKCGSGFRTRARTRREQQKMEPRLAETAHVLFVDLVGFSQKAAERQAQLVRDLSTLVRGTPEFQRAEADRELITLPTGDGMALVFFRYPMAPVHCAVEIARAAA